MNLIIVVSYETSMITVYLVCPGLLHEEAAGPEPLRVGVGVRHALVEEIACVRIGTAVRDGPPYEADVVRPFGGVFPVHRDGGAVRRRLAGEEAAAEARAGTEQQLVAHFAQGEGGFGVRHRKAQHPLAEQEGSGEREHDHCGDGRGDHRFKEREAQSVACRAHGQFDVRGMSDLKTSRWRVNWSLAPYLRSMAINLPL